MVRSLSLGQGGPGGDPLTETHRGHGQCKGRKELRPVEQCGWDMDEGRGGSSWSWGPLGLGMRVSSLLKVFGSTGKSEAGQWHELVAQLKDLSDVQHLGQGGKSGVQ